MKVFYESLHDKRISRSMWLSSMQRSQGSGAGRLVDGEIVKHDGLSGSHILIFQAIDAFLGLDRYFTDENMDEYVPVCQRTFCVHFKEHCFQDRVASSEVDAHSGRQFTAILKQMRASIQPNRVTSVLIMRQTFRVAHRTRAMPYLKHLAPKRLVMAAGTSVPEKPGETTSISKDILKPLDDMMLGRLQETV